MNSKPANMLLKLLNPTINLQIADVVRLPLLSHEKLLGDKFLTALVERLIQISRNDWDSSELSWDFKSHPLLKENEAETSKLSESNERWKKKLEHLFYEPKSNEEEVDRIFIEHNGLQNELTSEVSADSISISKANMERDIKSCISYAIGCAFGRYSLDEDGLIYAGGDFLIQLYGLTIFLNGEIMPSIPRLEFVRGKDMIISNGNLLKIDYMDSYQEGIEFYRYGDPEPIAEIIDLQTTIKIDLFETEDDTQICTIEYQYIVDLEVLD